MDGDGKDWTLKDSLMLGIVLSVPALMITLPIGFAPGSWRWPIIVHAGIFAVAIAGGLIAAVAKRSRAVMTTVTIVSWLAGVALGVALVVFGISLLTEADADCVPSETVTCRAISDTGQDLGEVSASEQKDREVIVAFIPIAPGAVILILMGVAAYRYLTARTRT